MTIFNLPDLGEGLQDAEVVAWHVGSGDHVVADQPLVSVETDKAVVEIPSPQSGQIAECLAEVGDILQVGDPLVAYEDAPVSDSKTVVGEILDEEAAPEPKTLSAGEAVKAAPAIRALAKRLGVDLGEVVPSGPGGTVTRSDVEGVLGGEKEAAPAEPLRGVRRAMAQKMARAHAEVVPATVTEEADLGSWKPESDVTLRLIRAVVAGCHAEPALNAWYLGLDQGRRLHSKIDLGLAMDTPDGLFVPVLRNVGERNPADLRRGLEEMKRDVRNRSVPLEELRGQTITLSNFGMFGGRHAALVLLPPQVAILGAGQIRDQVVAAVGQPVVRPLLPLSLTFDHRAVMGGEAARFLAAVVADLREPN